MSCGYFLMSCVYFIMWFVHYVMVCSLCDEVSSLCFVDFTSGMKLQYPGFTRYQELVKQVLRGAPVPALLHCQRLQNSGSRQPFILQVPAVGNLSDNLQPGVGKLSILRRSFFTFHLKICLIGQLYIFLYIILRTESPSIFLDKSGRGGRLCLHLRLFILSMLQIRTSQETEVDFKEFVIGGFQSVLCVSRFVACDRKYYGSNCKLDFKSRSLRVNIEKGSKNLEFLILCYECRKIKQHSKSKPEVTNAC